MASEQNTSNLSPVNEADKSTWPTIGCRIRASDVFFIDRAVLEIKQRTGRINYTRSEFLADAGIEKAQRVFGDAAETVRSESAA